MCNCPNANLLKAELIRRFEKRIIDLEKDLQKLKDERKQDSRLVYTKSCSLGDRSEFCFQHHPQPCGGTVTKTRR